MEPIKIDEDTSMRDVNMYFNGCLAYHPEDEDDMPYKFSVNQNSRYMYYVRHVANIVRDYRGDNRHEDYRGFVFPLIYGQFVNIGAQAAYLSRRFFRQSVKKGMSEDNTEISVLDFITMQHQVTQFWNPIFLGNLLLNNKPSFEEALNKVNSRYFVSVAFSDKFAVAASRYHRDLLLVYKNHVVGYVRDRKAYVKSNVMHLADELGLHCQIEVI